MTGGVSKFEGGKANKMPSVPMVWAPVHSAWNHKAVISPWMGQGAGASRLLRRKVSELFMIREIPADASSADWPCSQTNDRIFSEEKAVYGHV